jgi:hypothetical protein
MYFVLWLWILNVLPLKIISELEWASKKNRKCGIYRQIKVTCLHLSSLTQPVLNSSCSTQLIPNYSAVGQAHTHTQTCCGLSDYTCLEFRGNSCILQIVQRTKLRVRVRVCARARCCVSFYWKKLIASLNKKYRLSQFKIDFRTSSEQANTLHVGLCFRPPVNLAYSNSVLSLFSSFSKEWAEFQLTIMNWLLSHATHNKIFVDGCSWIHLDCINKHAVSLWLYTSCCNLLAPVRHLSFSSRIARMSLS